MGQQQILHRYAIVEHEATSAYLNIYDGLSIQRVIWELVPRGQQEGALFYLAVDRCKYLIQEIIAGEAAQHGWRCEYLGASSSREGQPLSRQLVLAYQADAPQAEEAFTIQIVNGPGERTATGGVLPQGRRRLMSASRSLASAFQRLPLRSATGCRRTSWIWSRCGAASSWPTPTSGSVGRYLCGVGLCPALACPARSCRAGNLKGMML